MTDFQFNYYQYKKRLNSNFKINFSIVFILIILFLGVAVFFKPTQKKQNLYFVEISSFQTYSSAINLANEIKSKQGAGYIYYDKNYRVLATFFLNKKDAENVALNLQKSYPNTQVYTLQINKNLSTFQLSKNQVEVVANLKENLQQTISVLSNATILLDKQELTFNKFIYQSSELLNNFIELNENFLNTFKQNSKHNVTKEYLNKILNNLRFLSSIEDEEHLRNNLKFYLVDVVINYANFINCFS